MQKERVVIIGSGPAGLSSAIYTARALLSPVVITGTQLGGQISLTSEVENYPGLHNPEFTPTGPQMVEIMQQQAEHFGARLVYDEVIEVDFRSGPPFIIKTHGQTYAADAVIVTAGASPKHLNVAGETEFTGRGVSYCGTCDGFFFRGKEVVVVGGGDSALEESIFLTKFATKVTIVHRRNEFRASKIMAQRTLDNPKIEVLWDSTITEILGEPETGVAGVRVKNLKTGAEREIAVKGYFSAIGHEPNTKIFRGKLAMNDVGYLEVKHPTTYTSVEGVFAAGDVADHIYRQAVSAAGEGCKSAIDVERWLAK